VRRADRPLALSLLTLAVAAAAIIMGPFLVRVLIAPLAGGTWLLVLNVANSVDQAALWSFLLLCAAVLFALRLAGAAMAAPPAAPSAAEEENSALSDLRSWRYLFAEAPRGARERAFARRELAALLCSAYAARFGVRNDYKLYCGFRDGSVPLPEAVRSFLFADEAADGRPGPAARIAAWARRASGKERAEYLSIVEELLDYIEKGTETSDE
jgi:hypothetical protein